MLSTPRTLRGAIVAVSPTQPLSRVVVFQYNPDEVSRTLQPREGGGSGGAGGGQAHAGADPHRPLGAPTETVSLTVELDATDQLAAKDGVAGTVGILPQLSVLEMLLHPDSLRVISRAVMLAAGSIEILPVEKPLAVLVYGPARVVPVKLTNLQITEQAHSPSLAPLRASVQIAATVLTYDDLPVTDIGFGLSVAHLVAKEVLATAGSAAGAVSAIADLVR
jgi:hypothetical protein